jgi:NhaP-type Na+/H+ or K+/H+ antiporter
MTPSRPLSRSLTTIAVVFLVLDGLLLGYLGLHLDRLPLVLGSAACLAVAGLVVLWWRRYRRDLADLERARREVRAEVESIRALLHGKAPPP